MKRYIASSRYGYGAIDEYEVVLGERDSCLRTTVSGITQKLSQSLAIELNCAYQNGRRDAYASLVGVTEIAQLAGVRSSAVSNWIKRGIGFPESKIDLRRGAYVCPYFDVDEVRIWLKETGRIKQALIPESF